MKWNYSKRLASVVAIFALAGACGLIVYASIADNLGVPIGTTQSITGPDGVCKKVTNNSPTGKQVYVPGSTNEEWQSFLANKPNGISFASCAALSCSWSSLGNVLPGNIANSQSAVIGGFMYLFGGRTSTTGVTSAIYRASTANPSSWSLVGNLPGPVHSGQLYIASDYIYLFGGRSGETAGDTTYLNTIYRASVANPTVWENTGYTLPGKLAYSSLVEVDGTLYLLGGSPSYEVYSGIIYKSFTSDPRVWTTTGVSLPVPLTTSQPMVWNGYVYLFGGRTGKGIFSNVIYRASTASPTVWSAVGTLPAALSFSQLSMNGDAAYLLGGYNGSSLASVYKASLANPVSWTLQAETLPGALDSSQVEMIGDDSYLLGGGNNAAWATPTVYKKTCVEIPQCSGVSIGGYCWYLGAAGQSCDTVCSTHAGCDVSGTRNYVGSGGTNAQCKAVVDALNTPYTYIVSDNATAVAIGCSKVNITNGERRRYIGSPTTCAATYSTLQRVCACTN